MNPQEQLCPNANCGARGKEGQIVIHSRKEGRYRCKVCRRTFSATRATALYGLKSEARLVTMVVTLLAYGCPIPAIVAAYGLDARTVRRWLLRAGSHCQQVHDYALRQWQADLQQVQADELKVRTQRGILWLAMSVMVSCRLWLGGAVSPDRDCSLLQTALQWVKRCARPWPLLLTVDGLTVYLKAMRLTFRDKVRLPSQRRRWHPWAGIQMVQVMFQTRFHRQDGFRTQVVQGDPDTIADLVRRSQGRGDLNTAYIERLNATFRQRLACLARHSRHALQQAQTLTSGMWLVGTVYNLCTPHQSLRRELLIATRWGQHRRWILRTPAMAAGWTDHCWPVGELLRYRVPPSLWRPMSEYILERAA